MDIETLKLFCDAIEGKNLTQVALANGISQPAVSQRLKTLEQKIGKPLIERHGSEIFLTEAGEIVHNGAKRIIAELREMERRVQEISGNSGGQVRVASIYSVGLYELDTCIKIFLTKYPEVQVHIEYSSASKIYQDVVNGSVDLAVVAYPTKNPLLFSIPFREDELVLICSPDHPFSQYKSISINQIDSQPFVAFQKHIPTRKALDDIFRRHGVAIFHKAEFDNIELIKRAVEINLGISVVPSIPVKSEVQTGTLKALTIAEGPFMRPIAVVYRRGWSLPSAVRNFMDVLTEKETGTL